MVTRTFSCSLRGNGCTSFKTPFSYTASTVMGMSWTPKGNKIDCTARQSWRLRSAESINPASKAMSFTVDQNDFPVFLPSANSLNIVVFGGIHESFLTVRIPVAANALHGPVAHLSRLFFLDG